MAQACRNGLERGLDCTGNEAIGPANFLLCASGVRNDCVSFPEIGDKLLVDF